ncbi:MAG TPA: heptaprenyl diphosphate synthase component 1 [Bacillota bacterium]|nr:heptaprenyl diphosphate synthase component 1 [Bacillota bacterium]
MGLLKNHFYHEFTDIIQEVNMHARNEFVQQYVDIPPVPLIRMQVLFLFLYDSGVHVPEIKKFLVPTLLVQIGLDCHQEVTLMRCESEREMRTRQLTILAGDYLSGKYYQLLARIEEVKLIRALAGSIYKINEWKTVLYYDNDLSTEEKLQVQNKIDSALFTSFIPDYSFNPDPAVADSWTLLMEQFIKVERLLDELLSYKLGNITKEYLQDLISECSHEEALNRLQIQIEQILKDINDSSNNILKNEVKEAISALIQECRGKISYQIQA